MSRSNAVTSNRQVLLREAANWLVKLDSGDLSSDDKQALQCWYQTSPEHKRVWQAACELQHDFSCLPSDLAKPVLNRQRMSRRTILKSLTGAAFLLPLGWSVSQNKPWQPLLADYRSTVGQQKSLTLTDGSVLTLNTDTALDIHIDKHQQSLHLYKGEVFIQTKKDSENPFFVITDQGSVRTLGAKFAVRCLPSATQVTVTQGAAQIATSPSVFSQQIKQDQQCLFSTYGIESIQTMQPHSLAWRHGELIVDNWRLDSFLQELARYRSGILRCNKNIAQLKVSGVFQTENTDQALEVLAHVLNLHISKYSNYWVSLSSAES